jgi:hypothetical protein
MRSPAESALKHLFRNGNSNNRINPADTHIHTRNAILMVSKRREGINIMHMHDINAKTLPQVFQVHPLIASQTPVMIRYTSA